MRYRILAPATAAALTWSAQSWAQGDALVTWMGLLEQRLARIERLVELSLQPWEPAGTLREVLDGFGAHDSPPDLLTYEYMIRRNGGMRMLTFSTWNGGWRAITDPHLRGDFSDPGGNKQNFVLGGSFWITGTQASEDDACDADVGSGKVRHFYYEYGSNGVLPRSSNGCVSESIVYRRKRGVEGDISP